MTVKLGCCAVRFLAVRPRSTCWLTLAVTVVISTAGLGKVQSDGLMPTCFLISGGVRPGRTVKTLGGVALVRCTPDGGGRRTRCLTLGAKLQPLPAGRQEAISMGNTPSGSLEISRRFAMA